MEKYGFVYIWRDSKHKRYYIGAHWGTENDGYICSSNRMRMSYARRPDNFKRRILSRHLSKDETFVEEYRILSLIKQEELGKKYYNHAIFFIRNGYTQKFSEERNKKVGDSNRGKPKSEDHVRKIKAYQSNRPQEHTDKMIKARMRNGKDKGLVPVKSIVTGENSRIQRDDPRYVSGEFVPVCKGLKQSQNQIDERTKKITGKKRTQESLERYKISGKENNKLARHSERQWYYNSLGERKRFLATDDISSDYSLGMWKTCPKKWYYNSDGEVLLTADDPPFGYLPGMGKFKSRKKKVLTPEIDKEII